MILFDATLVAINAKYCHTALGIRSIAKFSNNFKIKTLELTINDNFENMLQQIVQSKSPLVGFSCYIWNIELCLKLSSALKQVSPETIIFLGGPEVSFDCEEILKKNPFIDIIIFGEGEQAFNELLQNKQDLSKVSSIVYRCFESGDICFQTNPKIKTTSLDEIEFIYNENNLPKAPQIIYYESSRGCPFSCGFCLSANSKLSFLNTERTIKELLFFATQGANQVKLVDRTFNADKIRAKQIWSALIALDKSFKTNYHFEISADLIDEDTLTLLEKAPAGRFQFEIGVQSTNDKTLFAVNRKNDFKKITSVVNKIKSFGNIHLHLDLIAGLPFEDFKSFKTSFNDVFSLRPHMLQLGFLKLLKGSDLRKKSEQYGLVFCKDAPYRVLQTKWLSFEELFVLQQCENVIDRFYHSGVVTSSLEYVLDFLLSHENETAFDVFIQLISFCPLSSKPINTIDSLWDFAKSKNNDLANNVLKNLLIYDWLKIQKQGFIPFQTLQQLNEVDQPQTLVKNFYQNRAPQILNFSKTKAGSSWRFCHVYVFDYDVVENPKKHEKTAVFFNYLTKKNYKIQL